MADTRITRELHIAAEFLEGCYHSLRFVDCHGCILIPVKYPKRKRLQGRLAGGIVRKGIAGIPATADRHDCRESFRMFEREAPGAKATHAEAGQVNPVRVDFV